MPVISLAHNEQTKGRTKHLSVKLRFVFQNIQLGNIQVDHISSVQNTADRMTKSLSKRFFIGHRMQVVCSTDSATRGSVSKIFLEVRRVQNKNIPGETFLGVVNHNGQLFQRDGKFKSSCPSQKHISGDVAQSGFMLDVNNESREVYPSSTNG